MKLIVNNIEIDEAKKIALMLGRDFTEIEKEQKKKGKQVKEDKVLLDEMKADADAKGKKKKK
jgi:hypothetical protein